MPMVPLVPITRPPLSPSARQPMATGNWGVSAEVKDREHEPTPTASSLVAPNMCPKSHQRHCTDIPSLSLAMHFHVLCGMPTCPSRLPHTHARDLQPSVTLCTQHSCVSVHGSRYMHKALRVPSMITRSQQIGTSTYWAAYQFCLCCWFCYFLTIREGNSLQVVYFM
jgi:hypothetical protein